MQHSPALISASLLAANWTCFGQEAQSILTAGADWLHIDVMDNHYVPNLSFGAQLCEALRQGGITAPIDVHLMANPVERLIVDFAKAGASLITVHPEACLHVDRTLRLIKEQGCQAGLALNPATPLAYLDHVMELVDLVLIMTVNPGFGGQSFMGHLLPKIAQVNNLRVEAKRELYVQVDGGINRDNISAVRAAGADVFVMGSALFGASDYAKMVAMLRKLMG